MCRQLALHLSLAAQQALCRVHGWFSKKLPRITFTRPSAAKCSFAMQNNKTTPFWMVMSTSGHATSKRQSTATFLIEEWKRFCSAKSKSILVVFFVGFHQNEEFVVYGVAKGYSEIAVHTATAREKTNTHSKPGSHKRQELPSVVSHLWLRNACVYVQMCDEIITPPQPRLPKSNAVKLAFYSLFQREKTLQSHHTQQRASKILKYRL